MTFFGKTGSNMGPQSKFVVLGYIFLTRYGTCQTKIVCQIYVPGKLKHQFTQTRPIFLTLHLLLLGFWVFRVFHCFLIINRPSSFIVTQFRGLYSPHIFSEIRYHFTSQFIFHFVCKHFSVFDINEMKCSSQCIYVFMFTYVFYFLLPYVQIMRF